MVPIGEDPDIDTLAAILDCKVSALPMKYLRLPLGARFKISNPRLFGIQI